MVVAEFELLKCVYVFRCLSCQDFVIMLSRCSLGHGLCLRFETETMAKIENFEDLRCWQEARTLVKMVYTATNENPFSKDFDMRSQIRRAAISTMNNIAEGFGRFSSKEFIRFLEISFTSASEVKSICYAATDINYWTEEAARKIQEKAEHVKALNLGLIRYLNARAPQRNHLNT